jgi:hypothetical protein
LSDVEIWITPDHLSLTLKQLRGVTHIPTSAIVIILTQFILQTLKNSSRQKGFPDNSLMKAERTDIYGMIDSMTPAIFSAPQVSKKHALSIKKALLLSSH